MRIYFHLSGRLGNQLFQWAFLHELQAQGHKVHIFIDKYHNSELSKIDLNQVLDECPHLQRVQSRNILGLILIIHEKLISSNRFTKAISRLLPVFIEAEFIPKQRIGPIIIDGFFIDKKWPVKNNEVLLEEFRALKNKILERNSIVREILTEKDKTVIHIRRGDLYLFKDTFGLLSRDYYQKIDLKNRSIFILSDSINEAKEMFSSSEVHTFLDPSEIDVWAALIVMSSSSHLVMGNSTLSWWGAFFAIHDNNSTVTMPRPFYRELGKFDDLLYVDGFKTLDSDFE